MGKAEVADARGEGAVYKLGRGGGERTSSLEEKGARRAQSRGAQGTQHTVALDTAPGHERRARESGVFACTKGEGGCGDGHGGGRAGGQE